LRNAEWTPAPANEDEHEATLAEKIGGRNKLAVVVRKFERGRFCASLESMGRECLSFEASYGSRVDSLKIGRDVIRDKLLALGKNFAQRSSFSDRMEFGERSPLHKEQLAVVSCR
jgi:hypothetical protein